MNKSLTLLVLVLLTGCRSETFITDGKLQRVTVRSGDSNIEFGITKSKISPRADRIYYWFKNGQLQNTEGVYEGYLVDGLFSVYNKEGKLTTQGSLDNGLKTGTWFTYHQGELIRKEEFKKGRLSGKCQDFLDGELVQERVYKSGILSGLRGDITSDSVSQIRFRNGLPTDTVYVKKDRWIPFSIF